MGIANISENTLQDLAYAARTFRFNKGFFAVATLSLALGIGVNTAIFQLLDAVRLRTLPVTRAEQLAELQIASNDHCCSGNFSDRHSDFTYAQWEQIRDHQQAFSGVFAWGDHRFNLTDSGEPRFAEGLWVSGDFFRTLGVQPVRGHLLTREDDRAGCPSPGVIISYPFWQREFDGDPDIVGKQLLLDGHKLDVAGITPPGFYGVEVGKPFDVIAPLCAEPLIDPTENHISTRRDWWLAIIGRLNPGWSVARASAQANAMSPAVFENTVPPDYRADQVKYYTHYKLEAKPAGSGVSSLRDEYQQPLILLLCIAGSVLLIACSNLANLMLARASTREREMAVRLAIGANRWRLLRQLLAESLALALTGAVTGALLAQFLTRYLVRFLSTADNPISVELSLDWRVLGFTAGLAILTCVLFGLMPAIRATRTDPANAMKAGGRGLTADRQRFGLRRALVISQVALSLVLLVGALLFVRTLRNLMTVDAGFRQTGLMVVGIDASRLSLPPDARANLYRDLVADARRTPGVAQAASATIVPVSGSGWNEDIDIFGQSTKKDMVPWFDSVSSGYFRTMGTAILAGRDFNEYDTPASPEVAIVNEMFRDKFLGKANPIGKQFRVRTGPNEPQHVYQIVGLVRNSKYISLRRDFDPLVFVAEKQNKTPRQGINLLVRSGVSLGSLMPALRKTIIARNAELSFEFRPFETQVKDSLQKERLVAALSGFFGLLATALATVGLYGVLSYMVARRQSEIGIRMALGANRKQIVNLVIRETILLLAVGLALGAALTAATARAGGALLYGLKATDPLTIVAAIAAMTLVALAASAVPALRASLVQPITALREE